MASELSAQVRHVSEALSSVEGWLERIAVQDAGQPGAPPSCHCGCAAFLQERLNQLESVVLGSLDKQVRFLEALCTAHASFEDKVNKQYERVHDLFVQKAEVQSRFESLENRRASQLEKTIVESVEEHCRKFDSMRRVPAEPSVPLDAGPVAIQEVVSASKHDSDHDAVVDRVDHMEKTLNILHSNVAKFEERISDIQDRLTQRVADAQEAAAPQDDRRCSVSELISTQKRLQDIAGRMDILETLTLENSKELDKTSRATFADFKRIWSVLGDQLQEVGGQASEEVRRAATCGTPRLPLEPAQAKVLAPASTVYATNTGVSVEGGMGYATVMVDAPPVVIAPLGHAPKVAVSARAAKPAPVEPPQGPVISGHAARQQSAHGIP
eukprot:CAMPEP_0179348334 /NCGR_PEP_ID=MMETSP0797-20121207/73641_1 /TAXON_ID=47934 /ORGANISM="Dinophysis acuminata, Strain DAEP01" /LENGTH=382 /DNA_ID=CAMNT_0021063121 /DNA_START=128 /DNA_END=1276 /DNA_ORIENTATION=+